MMASDFQLPESSRERKCSVEGMIAACSNRDSLFRTNCGTVDLIFLKPTPLVKTLGSPQRNCRLNFKVRADTSSSDFQKDKVLLRVSKLHNGELGIDEHPWNMTVEVNGIEIPVGEGGPINITSAVERGRHRMNEINLVFPPYQTKTYVATVFLVGDVKNYQHVEGEYFRKMINVQPSEKMELRIQSYFLKYEDVGVDHLDVSLRCPISQKKIVHPCITWKCRHITCFDAATFLSCNVARPKCPICRVDCRFRDLLIDG